MKRKSKAKSKLTSRNDNKDIMMIKAVTRQEAIVTPNTYAASNVASNT